jgi:hypothetical protein
MNNLHKLKLKELENLYWLMVNDGYCLQPPSDFKGFKGRITKDRWIWGIIHLQKQQ